MKEKAMAKTHSPERHMEAIFRKRLRKRKEKRNERFKELRGDLREGCDRIDGRWLEGYNACQVDGKRVRLSNPSYKLGFVGSVSESGITKGKVSNPSEIIFTENEIVISKDEDDWVGIVGDEVWAVSED